MKRRNSIQNEPMSLTYGYLPPEIVDEIQRFLTLDDKRVLRMLNKDFSMLFDQNYLFQDIFVDSPASISDRLEKGTKYRDLSIRMKQDSLYKDLDFSSWVGVLSTMHLQVNTNGSFLRNLPRTITRLCFSHCQLGDDAVSFLPRDHPLLSLTFKNVYLKERALHLPSGLTYLSIHSIHLLESAIGDLPKGLKYLTLNSISSDADWIAFSQNFFPTSLEYIEGSSAKHQFTLRSRLPLLTHLNAARLFNTLSTDSVQSMTSLVSIVFQTPPDFWWEILMGLPHMKNLSINCSEINAGAMSGLKSLKTFHSFGKPLPGEEVLACLPHTVTEFRTNCKMSFTESFLYLSQRSLSFVALGAVSASLTGVPRLNKHLIRLEIDRIWNPCTPLDLIGILPDSLEVLEIKGTCNQDNNFDPVNLSHMPSSLTRLYIGYDVVVASVSNLPKFLRFLHLRCEPRELNGIIPPSIRELEIDTDKEVQGVFEIPSFLKTLLLSNCNFDQLLAIPTTLKNLHIREPLPPLVHQKLLSLPIEQAIAVKNNLIRCNYMD